MPGWVAAERGGAQRGVGGSRAGTGPASHTGSLVAGKLPTQRVNVLGEGRGVGRGKRSLQHLTGTEACGLPATAALGG